MECEMVVIEGGGSDDPNGEKKMNGQDRPRKTQKRKRTQIDFLTEEEKGSQIETLRNELDGLFGYYKEVMGQKEDLGLDPKQCLNGGANAVVAFLMEERDLPLSKLVDEIHNQVKNLNNDAVSESLTVATVKSTVVFVGQRMMYGVPNADADVLEDHSDSCLWCWEVELHKIIIIIIII